jgi:hypothetical protein
MVLLIVSGYALYYSDEQTRSSARWSGISCGDAARVRRATIWSDHAKKAEGSPAAGHLSCAAKKDNRKKAKGKT